MLIGRGPLVVVVVQALGLAALVLYGTVERRLRHRVAVVPASATIELPDQRTVSGPVIDLTQPTAAPRTRTR
jgi:hypothetical protein